MSVPKYISFPKIKYFFCCSEQLLLYWGLIGVVLRAGEYECFARFGVNFISLVDSKLQPSQVFLPFLSLPLFRSCAIPVSFIENLSSIDSFPTLLKRHKEAREDGTWRIVFLLKQVLGKLSIVNLCNREVSGQNLQFLFSYSFSQSFEGYLSEITMIKICWSSCKQSS